MRIFLFLTFTVLVFIIFFIFKESNYKKENDVLLEKEISKEIEEKILDLTSLSSRISKKNIYLNLEKISRGDLSTEANNLLAINKVINFDESFADIIPGDILNINLFGNNFQKEIKTVNKSNSNKIIRTKSLDNENESFLVIGNELAFGKFHIDGKVFLLNKNENLTYITNTSEADLEIPQFSEEDYSLEKK